MAASLAAVLGIVATLVACSAPPQQQAPTAPAAAASAAVEGVVVQDRRGPLSPDRAERDLARLRAEGRAADVQRQLDVLAAAGEADLLRGNSARLLVDGPATFAAMRLAIGAARHRVLLQSYIFEDSGVAAEFGELLLRKAAEGVSVALMYDSIGSIASDAAFFKRLQAGGVAVCAFNPLNPLARPGSWGLLERNHRKLLAADSDVVFIGGINISNVYSSGSAGGSGSGRGSDETADAKADGWRDTQVELRGPVVAAIAAVFRESWLGQACPGSLPPAPPPQVAAPGQRVIKVVASDPRRGVNPTYRAMLAAVGAARHSVHLTMAYFAPGVEMVQALRAAAARGVDVALVLPGRSDVALVQNAARSHYAELMQAGVRIHEMGGKVMHAKTAVIDGVFSSVGSSNLDWRSIAGNNEIDVIVLGDDFGQAMEAVFSRDLAASTRITPADWARRGLGQRLLESFGRLVEPLL